MSTPTKRNYRATFILDNRGKQETVEQIVDGVKKDIAAVQGDVTSVENIGKKDFARVTYLQVHQRLLRLPRPLPSAPPQGPAELKERLRLNSSVYRTFVQEV